MKKTFTLFVLAFALTCLPVAFAADTPQTTSDKPAEEAAKQDMKAPGCASACRAGSHDEMMKNCCKGMQDTCIAMKKDSDEANARLDMLLAAAKKDKAGKATIQLLEELVAQQKTMNEQACKHMTGCMQTRAHLMMGLMGGMDGCCKKDGDKPGCPMMKDGEMKGCPMKKENEKPADAPDKK